MIAGRRHGRPGKQARLRSARESVYAALVFSFLRFVVAVPSAIKVFDRLATLHKGTFSFEAPMLYALGV